MKKVFDYGFLQTRIVVDPTHLRYKVPGKKESSIPIEHVAGAMYESELAYGYVVILGAGTKLDRIRVPKGKKSMKTTEDLALYLKAVLK